MTFSTKTKTSKSKLQGDKLAKILEVFKWKATLSYQGLYVKCWRVVNQQGDCPILLQSSSSFFMGAVDQDEYLEGVFKGYEDPKVFKKALLLKGVDLDD